MNIIVSGKPGTGTTTLCKKLAEHYGYTYVYAGNFFRKMAKQAGQSIETFHAELAKYPDKEKEIDRFIEQKLINEDRMIVEGRMAPFMSCGFPHHRILLSATEHECAWRLQGREEYADLTVEQIEEEARRRLEVEAERYEQLYNIVDHFAEDRFNIHVDTKCRDPDGVLKQALLMINAANPFPPTRSPLLVI